MMQKLRAFKADIVRRLGKSRNVGELGKSFCVPGLVGATCKPSEGAARAEFPEFGSARRGGHAHAVFPQHRGNNLFREGSLDVSGVGDRLPGRIAENCAGRWRKWNGFKKRR